MAATFNNRSSLTLTSSCISHSQRLSLFPTDDAKNNLGMRSPRWVEFSKVLGEL